jgi:hypothetical protein
MLSTGSATGHVQQGIALEMRPLSIHFEPTVSILCFTSHCRECADAWRMVRFLFSPSARKP